MTKDITSTYNNKFKNLSSNSISHKINNSNYYKCFQNYYHAHKYLNPNPVYYSDVKINVNHWQLRDLLQINQQNGDIYYTKDNSINVLKSNQNSSSCMGLNYSPRCFSQSNYGALVAGGVLTSVSKAFSNEVIALDSLSKFKSTRPSKGLFSFHNPSFNYTKTFKLGEMINNSVTVYPTSNTQYKSYICNNDSNLYTVDINNNGTFTIDNQISCEFNTSLNNSIRNPTNEKITTVSGDSSSIFLLDTTIANPKIKSVKTNHESGFGISYHPNGNIFATSFQDGSCLLFDIRKLVDYKPLVEIKSTRPGHQSGAFRCCKFSNSALNDILVISEHVGRVHLIDLRHLTEDNVNDHQVIVFPFALDQFADYKKGLQSGNEKIDTNDHFSSQSEIDSINCQEKHNSINIYGDASDPHSYDSTYLQFTAPLVYDYEYLTTTNPKLFKGYTYQAPPVSSTNSYLPPPELNYPQWHAGYDTASCNTDLSSRSSQMTSIDFNEEQTSSMVQQVALRNVDTYNSSSIPRTSTATSTATDYVNHYQDAYRQSVNHIHGEMELSGIDWYDRKLLIGCEDGGILSWDINVLARRSFGSCSCV